MEKLVKILVEEYVYTYKWTDLPILSIGWFYRGAINFRSRHIKFRSGTLWSRSVRTAIGFSKPST